MKTPFCYIGIHNWEYRKERHNVINHPSGRESIRVIVRECKWCRHREHHSLPRVGGKFTLWRNFDDIKKDDSVKFERL
jgi:hypothetical protein